MPDTNPNPSEKQIYVVMVVMTMCGRPLPLVPLQFFAFCSTAANRVAAANDLLADKNCMALVGALTEEMVGEIAMTMHSVADCLNVAIAAHPGETELTPFGSYRYFPMTCAEEEVDATVAQLEAQHKVQVLVFINADMLAQMQASIASVSRERITA